mgnify:CR=1 FL=1
MLNDGRFRFNKGRKKINEYTRYLTVGLCLVQSWFYVKYYLMRTSGQAGASLIDQAFLSNGTLHWGWQITTVLTMTCGTIFLMWLGEQIDEFGIGNGISLLIMAGILARMPAAGIGLFKNFKRELVGIVQAIDELLEPAADEVQLARAHRRAGRVDHHGERQGWPISRVSFERRFQPELQ